jgi:hypothetical protein
MPRGMPPPTLPDLPPEVAAWVDSTAAPSARIARVPAPDLGRIDVLDPGRPPKIKGDRVRHLPLVSLPAAMVMRLCIG